MNMTEVFPNREVHHGHNVKRFREIFGIRQETIAFELDMTQQNFSKLEQKKEIEEDILEKIAKILKIPVNAIKNLSDEGVINIISNTLHDNDNASVNYCHFSTFNPVEKIVELYERILQEKNEKIALYEQMTKEMKVD